MSDSFLDFFQLIVAVYLFYLAWKGNSQTFQLDTLSEEEQLRTRKKLRVLYLICGCIALSEFGISTLKNQMFTQAVSDSGAI